MAVAFRSESHTIAATGANADPGLPAGSIQGDVWFGLIVVDGSLAAPSLPSGWTALYTLTSPRGTTSSGFKTVAGYIAWTGTQPATAFANASGYREAFIVALSGANTSSPIDSQSASGGTAQQVSTFTPCDPPSTTAVAAATLAISGAINWNGSGTAWVASTGYTIRSNNAAGNDSVLQTKTLSAAGAEDPSTITGGASGNGDLWHGFTVTIAPAVSGSAHDPTKLVPPGLFISPGNLGFAPSQGDTGTVGTNFAITGVAGTFTFSSSAGTVSTSLDANQFDPTQLQPPGPFISPGSVFMPPWGPTDAGVTILGVSGLFTFTGTPGSVVFGADANQWDPTQLQPPGPFISPASVFMPTVYAAADFTITGVSGSFTFSGSAGVVYIDPDQNQFDFRQLQPPGAFYNPASVFLPAPWGSSQTGAQDFSITGTAGSFTFTGAAGTVTRDTIISGVSGTFTFTGSAGSVTTGFAITGTSGQFSFGGSAGTVTVTAGDLNVWDPSKLVPPGQFISPATVRFNWNPIGAPTFVVGPLGDGKPLVLDSVTCLVLDQRASLVLDQTTSLRLDG